MAGRTNHSCLVKAFFTALTSTLYGWHLGMRFIRFIHKDQAFFNASVTECRFIWWLVVPLEADLIKQNLAAHIAAPNTAARLNRFAFLAYFSLAIFLICWSKLKNRLTKDFAHQAVSPV